MSEIAIRPASQRDAADLAILDNLAGHGIPLAFWLENTDSNRIEDALAIGRDRIADDNGFYNWKKGRIAVEDDQILGMTMNYIMPEPDEQSEAIKQNNAAFKPVFELYDLCEGHWFIDALSVYPSAQGKGTGRLLLEDSIALGKQSPAGKMSLIVEDTNEVASALYRYYDFEIIDQRDFVPFDGALEINEWILMSKDIS